MAPQARTPLRLRARKFLFEHLPWHRTGQQAMTTILADPHAANDSDVDATPPLSLELGVSDPDATPALSMEVAPQNDGSPAPQQAPDTEARYWARIEEIVAKHSYLSLAEQKFTYSDLPPDIRASCSKAMAQCRGVIDNYRYANSRNTPAEQFYRISKELHTALEKAIEPFLLSCSDYRYAGMIINNCARKPKALDELNRYVVRHAIQCWKTDVSHLTPEQLLEFTPEMELKKIRDELFEKIIRKDPIELKKEYIPNLAQAFYETWHSACMPHYQHGSALPPKKHTNPRGKNNKIEETLPPVYAIIKATIGYIESDTYQHPPKTDNTTIARKVTIAPPTSSSHSTTAQKETAAFDPKNPLHTSSIPSNLIHTGKAEYLAPDLVIPTPDPKRLH